MIERNVAVNEKLKSLIDNVEKVIVGKRQVIELIVAAVLSGGHVLVEDVPGVGKTQLVAALAKSCDGEFNRVQMTPDIMPSDITGFTFVSKDSTNNTFKKGAAFCNFLLADEINRSSPKSQSALLEIMEEKQVSMDGETYELPKPFLVLATQNSVETYGTYHLPEAQMDRFIMKISLGYPSKDEEIRILSRNENNVSVKNLVPVITCEELAELCKQSEGVICSDNIKKYIIDIVNASRSADYIKLGVSPRGSIALQRMAKAYAFVNGRDFVLPDDVKALAPFVLAHRIMLTPKGKSVVESKEEAIKKLVEEIEVTV